VAARSTHPSVALIAEPNGGTCDIDPVIVDASPTDLAAVIDLDAQLTGVARADFWNDFHHHRATSETLCLLIAKTADEIVGYAVGEVRAWPVRTPACGWLYAIGVKKEQRLSRTATALMAELTDRFRAHGVYTIRTMIDIDDYLLMSFLRSLGMTAGPFIELEMSIEQ
jgi:GNAT superfamily N-acetyltransferase